MKRVFRRAVRIALTLAAVAVGVVLATALWRHYMIAPWTRDARVRAEIVSVAPEVAGPVIDLRVADNQMVRKGDILFVIDPRAYEIAVRQLKAALEGQTHSTRLARSRSQRRALLTDLSVSKEEKEQFDISANVADAATEQARAALAMAELNLERTRVRAPVNGSVANLRLRQGDFLAAGQPTLTLIDSDSFWLAGYFEETQIAAIHPGDEARWVLMGYPGKLLHGRVASISRGIADQDSGGAGASLPSVNPVFTWVRLAQRIPVRVEFDAFPQDVTLAAGMTATVETGHPSGLRDDLAWALAYWRQGWRF